MLRLYPSELGGGGRHSHRAESAGKEGLYKYCYNIRPVLQKIMAQSNSTLM